MKKSKKALKAFVSILIVFILIFITGYIIPFLEKVDTTPVKNTSDWMSEIDGKTPLNAVKIPGTHDSATEYVQLAFFSKCQALSIKEQLECGFRYLDIRLGADNDKLMLMHGFTKCKKGPLPWSPTLFLDDVLKDCYNFLEKHPSETVIFAVKQEYGNETAAQFQTLLNNYISQNEDKWLLTDTIPDLNTSRGKLVLMRRYQDNAGLGKKSGIPLIWEKQSGSKTEPLNFEINDNGNYKLFVQDKYEYKCSDKRKAFEELNNKCNDNDILSGNLFINFLSTKGAAPVGHPYFYAKKLNSSISDKDTGKYGWIIIDFADSKFAHSIFRGNKEYNQSIK
ncbi:MAG: phosphatidylinositol-specific phospholipase C domain-containing protein [Candidatus Fimenecus sp.]